MKARNSISEKGLGQKVKSLVSYNAKTGDLTWKTRTAQHYKDANFELSQAIAEQRAWLFNNTRAGSPVGTDQTNGGSSRRMRLSFGEDVPTQKINVFAAAFMAATGKDIPPDLVACPEDGDPYNLKPDNVVLCSRHAYHILNKPDTGIESLKGHEPQAWTWIVRIGNRRRRGVGEVYYSMSEARAARDQFLASQGLLHYTKLSELLDDYSEIHN